MIKERPILFNAHMVRAILNGSKTQTRRALKVQPLDVIPMLGDKAGVEWVGLMTRESEPKGTVFHCKFGVPGDLLWVRETFAYVGRGLDPGYLTYRATYPRCLPPGLENVPDDIHEAGERWTPSIHMPRKASRINLEITGVRVERLQDISEVDAITEGVEPIETERYDRDFAICPCCGGTRLYDAIGSNMGVLPDTDCTQCDIHAKRYKHLWESINGPGSWDENPWVWCIEFKRVLP